jgi:hypothetical protein
MQLLNLPIESHLLLLVLHSQILDHLLGQGEGFSEQLLLFLLVFFFLVVIPEFLIPVGLNESFFYH